MQYKFQNNKTSLQFEISFEFNVQLKKNVQEKIEAEQI